MVGFLDKLEGSSERWLRSFSDTLATTRKKREQEIEKARAAGLKDKVKRLENMQKFWIKHPELEALHILRAQNSDAFDQEYPEHANLKEINPRYIENIFMQGAPGEEKVFEARVANPATRRIAIISDLKTNPKYGENAYERFKHLVPGGDIKSLNEYALNQKVIDNNFDNSIVHARTIDKARVDYDRELQENPKFLDEMMSPNYLANKDAIDAGISKRAAILKKIDEYNTYRDDQNEWTRKLAPHIEILKNALDQSWTNRNVLNSRDMDRTISYAGTTIPQMQEAIGRKISGISKDEGNIRAVFDSIATKMGYSSDKETLDALYAKYGASIINNWEFEKSDQRAAQKLMRAYSKETGEPENAAERMKGLESFVSSILENTTDMGRMPATANPDKYKTFKENQEKELNVFTGETSPAGPEQQNEPTEEERTGQTALVQPDHILETLSLYGVHVWPTGVYRRKVGAMPGALGNAELIPEEELPIILADFFAKRGMPPELTDYALRKVNQYAMGVDPHQILAENAIVYGRLIKNINDAKDDPTKLEEIYKQFGAGASTARKIGGIIVKHISKGTPLAKIPQYLNKEFNIPVPAVPTAPTSAAPALDPIAQAKGAEQIKQEQLKTQKLQADMEAEQKSRAAKEQLEQDKIAHDQEMEKQKMQMDQQSMQMDKQAKSADLGMRAQEIQANQQMKLQDFEQKQQMAQVKQQADMQAQQAQLEAQKQQAAAQQQQAAVQQQQPVAEPSYEEATGTFLKGVQTTTPHARDAKLRWDPQRGGHVASAKMGNDPKQREYEFDVDEATMKQHGLSQQHIAALKRGPQQQVQQPQQPTRQATILPEQQKPVQQKPKVE